MSWFCHKDNTDVFINTKNCSHGDSPTKLNFYIFYYCKYHCDRQGPARFRSLGFGKHKRIPQGRRTQRCLVGEQGIKVPVGHFRLKLSEPCHSKLSKVNTVKPPLFLYNHFIHPYAHFIPYA